MGLVGELFEWLLSVPGWLALAAVFLFPALEASAFVGIVVPGEAAILMGGVLASQGRISLAAALAAAILGAVVGDSVGYAVGRRWGRATLARFSKRLLKQRRIERAEESLRRHPGWAITMGRFAPGLRTFVPGVAGMSRVHYPTFLFYNVLGAVLWGSTFVPLGYVAGWSWEHVHAVASGGGLALLVLMVLGYWLVRSYRTGRLARLRGAQRRGSGA
jgi:undecaprenyl-diphosphatase